MEQGLNEGTNAYLTATMMSRPRWYSTDALSRFAGAYPCPEPQNIHQAPPMFIPRLTQRQIASLRRLPHLRISKRDVTVIMDEADYPNVHFRASVTNIPNQSFYDLLPIRFMNVGHSEAIYVAVSRFRRLDSTERGIVLMVAYTNDGEAIPPHDPFWPTILIDTHIRSFLGRDHVGITCLTTYRYYEPLVGEDAEEPDPITATRPLFTKAPLRPHIILPTDPLALIRPVPLYPNAEPQIDSNIIPPEHAYALPINLRRRCYILPTLPYGQHLPPLRPIPADPDDRN